MAVQGLPTLYGPGPAASPPPRPPSASDGVGLDQLFAVLRRRKRLILAVICCGTLLAAAIGSLFPPLYRASASIIIDSTDASFIQLLENRTEEGIAPDRLSTEIELMRSRSHIQRVMSQLGLFDEPAYQPPADDQAVAIHLPEPLRTMASWLPASLLISAGVAEEPVPARGGPTPPNQFAIDKFSNKLAVEQSSDSRIINVIYTSAVPEEAAAIANAMAQTYVASQVEYKRELAQGAVNWLEQRLANLQGEVEGTEQRVARFRAEAGLSTRPDGSTANDQRLENLNTQLTEARAQRIAADSKLQRAQAVTGAPDGALALADITGSLSLASLHEQTVTLQRQLAQMSETFGPNHPQMQSLRAELNDVQRSINLAVDRSLQSLTDDAAAAREREALVERDLAAVQGSIDEDQRESVRLQELERQADANRRLYEMFLGHLKEAQSKVAQIVPDARVISMASPPERASSPGPLVFAMVGFTVSLLFGPLLAFMMEHLDRRVFNTAAIEQRFGLTALGLLPRLAKSWMREQPGAYIKQAPFSAYAEAARSIVTTLRPPETSGCSVFMVTSALPGEGKTTLSVTLAAAAAESGLRTLLVDLDLRRPAIEHRLDVETLGEGLTEFLRGDLPRSALVRRDAASDIDYVCVGRPPAKPLEVVKSQELRALFSSWRRDYDQIIVDSAPVLAVTDTKVAARLADSVVLAARWRGTDIEAVGHAMKTLRDAGIDILGCVLTAVNMDKYKLYARGEAGAYYKQYRQYYLD